MLPSRLLLLALALAVPLAAAVPNQPFLKSLAVHELGDGRFIRDTPGNQGYFDDAQAIIAEGTFDESAGCGAAGRDAIVNCIRECNSPGPRRRGQCCCVAQGGDFRIGLAGSCRYKQVVLNFSNSDPPFMQYESRPPSLSSGQAYFDSQSCEATNQNDGGQPCSCELVWSLDSQAIKQFTPKPTPSVSPSPASPTPKPSVAPPSPAASAKPSKQPQPSKGPGDGAVVTPPSDESSGTPTPAAEVAERDPTPLPPPGGLGSGATATPPVEGGDDEAEPSAEPTGEAESASSDDGGGDICVDAKWLAARGAQQVDLVHATHRLARVLCPDNGLPCGTRNHAVRDATGAIVSYADLCARDGVKCSHDEMEVNSVWSHMWTETHHEGGVRLTMLDVRYPGVAQKALHRVMRALRTAGAL